MKKDAFLINTSRGGVVDEKALFTALQNKTIGGAAIDVFEKEPYIGPLQNLSNCLLTSHMGSMSLDCRNRMEIEATEEVIRYLVGKPLLSPVPEEEYDLQKKVKLTNLSAGNSFHLTSPKKLNSEAYIKKIT